MVVLHKLVSDSLKGYIWAQNFGMTTQWLLEEVATITERNLDLIKKKFTSLSENQLNWRPNAQTWSCLEIFAHLNGYASFYHAAFNKKIEITRFRTPSAQFSSSPLGRSAWQSMKLGKEKNIKRRFNAPKDYNPTVTPSLVNETTLLDFQNHQKELLNILEKSVAVNLRKVKVPISISKIVRLRLGDAFLFVAYHNERHMQQALNLLKHPQFPKK